MKGRVREGKPTYATDSTGEEQRTIAADITVIRAAVRKDLHDDPADRWTDTVLDRHIARAALEYSLHAPREQKDTLATVAASRDVSLSTLTGRIAVEAVEWPTGEFPPRRVGFTLWQDTLTMDVVSAPGGVENVNVFWTKTHTLDGSTSTVPAPHDDLIAAGAAAYAALDWTSFASNRINTGGDDVWGRYRSFADERLGYFRAELARIARNNTVRQRRMYTTDAPSIFEQDRVKY
ncbi:MAG: hypothetical protein WD359_07715 [Dehalococcoidia bacterium]